MEYFEVERDIEDFLNGKIAVNCRTEEDAKEFLNRLKVYYGIFWHSDSDLSKKINWYEYKNQTCYFSLTYVGNKCLQYSDIDYYIEEGRTVFQYRSSQYQSSQESIIIDDTNLDRFLRGEIAVNCPTEKEAEEFLNYLYNKYNIMWSNEKKLSGTYWDACKSKTCYNLCRDNRLGYGTIDAYSFHNDCDILPYNSLFVSREQKSELNLNKKRKIIILNDFNLFT